MIDREIIMEVVKDSLEWEPPSLVERELKVPLELKIKRAVTIIGPRRAGKTYYMFQLIKTLLEKGVPRDRILYINLEDYRLEGADHRDLAKIIETYYEIHPQNRRKKVWLFLDEVQNVASWEKTVRTLIDTLNAQIYLTGSSSKLLSLEVATQLRGRTLTYEIYPFSFREYLKARGIKADPHPSSRQKSLILKALHEYLIWGGYPEAVLEPRNREKILQEIWEVTIARDIIDRWKIRNTKALRLLIRAIQESREFSVHKFHKYLKTLGIKVSKNTLYSYLEHLHDSLIAYPLRKYHPTYKQIEASIPKIYLVDNGLYPRKDEGKLLENLVFTELKRRGLKENRQIYYWKDPTGKEVDFIVMRQGKATQLIQATLELTHQNLEREVKPLLKAAKQLNPQKLTIITWNQQQTIKTNKHKIQVTPLWKWLITPNTPRTTRKSK